MLTRSPATARRAQTQPVPTTRIIVTRTTDSNSVDRGEKVEGSAAEGDVVVLGTAAVTATTAVECRTDSTGTVEQAADRTPVVVEEVRTRVFPHVAATSKATVTKATATVEAVEVSDKATSREEPGAGPIQDKPAGDLEAEPGELEEFEVEVHREVVTATHHEVGLPEEAAAAATTTAAAAAAALASVDMAPRNTCRNGWWTPTMDHRQQQQLLLHSVEEHLEISVAQSAKKGCMCSTNLQCSSSFALFCIFISVRGEK